MPTDPAVQAARDLMFVRKRKMGLPAAFSIGDSWFDYPIYDNVIDLVDSMDFFAIKRHETSGARLQQVVVQISGPKALAPFDAHTLFVSGGGNDIVEKSWIAHLFQTDVGQPVFDLLDAQYWQHRIDYFQEEYGDLVRGHNAEGTAVVLHGYDWLIPTGDGVTFDGFWKGKPWVRPAMLDANIIDVGRQNALGKKIVEDFNDLVIAPLADGARFPDGRLKVTYVNCRDAVKPASEWANELHPTPTGFKEVAARFVPLLPDLLP